MFCPGHVHADMVLHVLSPAGLMEMSSLKLKVLQRVLGTGLDMHSWSHMSNAYVLVPYPECMGPGACGNSRRLWCHPTHGDIRAIKGSWATTHAQAHSGWSHVGPCDPRQHGPAWAWTQHGIFASNGHCFIGLWAGLDASRPGLQCLADSGFSGY